jgi:hypothetical protein
LRWGAGGRARFRRPPNLEPCRGQSQACQEPSHGFAESRHSNYLVMPLPDKCSDGSETSGERHLHPRLALPEARSFSGPAVLFREGSPARLAEVRKSPVKRESEARGGARDADVQRPIAALVGEWHYQIIRMATLREAMRRFLARLALSPARFQVGRSPERSQVGRSPKTRGPVPGNAPPEGPTETRATRSPPRAGSRARSWCRRAGSRQRS